MGLENKWIYMMIDTGEINSFGRNKFADSKYFLIIVNVYHLIQLNDNCLVMDLLGVEWLCVKN